ncbi:hypothetical protein NYW84_06170 [Acinetobacter junii]|uniref:hypothetical protein n=1 Tax=Acinetobacter TaxID=469 RepID=UPI001022E610|nr:MULTISPECIES: hypothetical protein [Acinetobacter]MEB8380646.1 hypothetical protein [Acinetobacter junii]RZG86780.1 hypothetical protein EXE10_06105 [Acinetobacter sp. WCHAc060033]
MASMTERKCKYCLKVFLARTADVNRGWAKFCSKSCKAKEQEKRTGQNAAYKNMCKELDDERIYHEACAANEMGWDGHKDAY